MRDIHPIRLRGPWQYELLARTLRPADGTTSDATADLPASGRVKMPCQWSETLGGDFVGQVRFARHFGSPTAVEPHETIWLVIEAIDARVQVLLNDSPLGVLQPGEPGRFKVTEKLNQRNELVLEVDAWQPPAGLVGEVRLEIHGVEYAD